MFNVKKFTRKELCLGDRQFKLLFAFRKQLEIHYNVRIFFYDRLKWNVSDKTPALVLGHNDNIKEVEKFIFKEGNYPFTGTDNELEKIPVTPVSSKTSENASENTFQDNECKYQQYFRDVFKKTENKLKQFSRFSEKCEEYIFHNKNKADSLTHELTECYLVSGSEKNSKDVTNKRKGVFQGSKWHWQLARESLKIFQQQTTTSNTSDVEICQVHNKNSVSKYILHNQNKPVAVSNSEFKKDHLSSQRSETSDVTSKRKNTLQGKKCKHPRFEKSMVKHKISSNDEECEASSKTSLSKYILHNQNKREFKKDHLSSQKSETSDVTSKRKNIFQGKKCKHPRFEKSIVKHKLSSNVSNDKECEASSKTSLSNYMFHNKDKTGTLLDELIECYLVSGSKKKSKDVTSKRKGVFQGNKWRWQLARDSLKKIEQQTMTSNTSDAEICDVHNKISISFCRRRLLQSKYSFSCTEKDSCEVIKSRQQENLQSSNNSQMVLQTDDKENIGVANNVIVRSLSVGPLLRPIVIDGKNVATMYKRRKERSNEVIFCKRIEISVQYFLERGHTQVTVFVPRYFEHSKRALNACILQKLLKKRHLIYTPTRTVPEKFSISYNRGFILKMALMSGGVILSNDKFSDLLIESELSRKTVQERLLKFSFAGELLVIPQNPLGKEGPTLTEFLSFPAEDKCMQH